MGQRTGLWTALLSGIADTIHEASGRLMGRLTDALEPSDTVVELAETHRWPTSGRVAVNGDIGRYDGLSPTQLTGFTEDDDVSTWDGYARKGDVVMLLSTQCDIDVLRDSFFLDTAEGADLDIIGRNYGVTRPFGVDDDTFRALLMVMIYLPAGTIAAIEAVMDAYRGPGNYTVYELLPDDRHHVYVSLPATAGDNPKGKAYLVGLEAQASTGTYTVDVDHEPNVVSGIWDASDPYRKGTNYAEDSITVTLSPSNRVITSAPYWQVSDEGLSLYLTGTGELWTILSYLDPQTVQVGKASRSDAYLNPGDPDLVTCDGDAFRSWMVGHKVQVYGTRNGGNYTITEYINPRQVRVSGSSFVLETDATIQVRADWTTPTSDTARLFRATWTGTTITAPQALPANVLVDYATQPSAQTAEDRYQDGNAQWCYYLWDDAATVQQLLDVITVAGVEPVIEVT